MHLLTLQSLLLPPVDSVSVSSNLFHKEEPSDFPPGVISDITFGPDAYFTVGSSRWVPQSSNTTTPKVHGSSINTRSSEPSLLLISAPATPAPHSLQTTTENTEGACGMVSSCGNHTRGSIAVFSSAICLLSKSFFSFLSSLNAGLP